jgi:hypothetical protein
MKKKSCLSSVWRKAPKRASSFFPAPALKISGTRSEAKGAKAGSPFLCLLSFGEAKESEAVWGATPVVTCTYQSTKEEIS